MRNDTLQPKGNGRNERYHAEWIDIDATQVIPAENRSLRQTPNGNSERSNPHTALARAGVNRMRYGGRIAPEANAQGNAWDMQTGARLFIG
jgi:hypothetical protein